MSGLKRTFLNSVYEIATNPVYVFTTLGYGFLTFTMGGISLWAADYFQGHLNEDLDYVTKMFGLVSAVAGLTGAAVTESRIAFVCFCFAQFFPRRAALSRTSWVVPMDALALVRAHRARGSFSSLLTARTLLVGIVFTLPGVVCAVVAMVTTNKALTFTMSGVGMFCFVAVFRCASNFSPSVSLLISAPLSPVISVILACVPSDLRAFAYSLALFFAHLIGDFPSPSAVGLFASAFGSLTVAMVILCLWTLGGTLLWSAAFVVAIVKARRGDYDILAEPVVVVSESSDSEAAAKAP